MQIDNQISKINQIGFRLPVLPHAETDKVVEVEDLNLEEAKLTNLIQ